MMHLVIPAEWAQHELTRWGLAFPSNLDADVRAAIQAIPARGQFRAGETWMSPGSIDSVLHPAGINLGGEPLLIPSRLYCHTFDPAQVPAHLTARQRTILGCVFTRHHNGYERQTWLRQVVGSDEPWVAPFVVQLLGEYVVQIHADIVDGLPGLDDPTSAKARIYGDFAAENPGFMRLTRQRVASYFDCYHRGAYLDADHYPAEILLAKLRRITAAHQVSAHQVSAHQVSAHQVSAHQVSAHQVSAHQVSAHQVSAHQVSVHQVSAH